MSYIHGYSEEEQNRLIQQNEVLAPYIYQWHDLADHRHIVEIGCGVGAQMITLLHQYPELYMTGIEHAPRQLQRAGVHLSHFPAFAGRFAFLEGDAEVIRPRFDQPIDGALMVWVLEHVRNPKTILKHTRSWLPEDCPLWVTEVFHPGFHTWPRSEAIMKYWTDTLTYQSSLGGDPAIGIRLNNLLVDAGFEQVIARPHLFYLDRTNPAERDKMLTYWLDLMRSAFHETAAAGYTSLECWQEAEHDMRELRKRDDAVFYYTFFQATGRTPVQKRP